MQGIGPTFRLLVKVQNTSKAPARNVRMALSWDEGMYDIAQSSELLPYLVPGVSYSRSFMIQVRACFMCGCRAQTMWTGNNNAPSAAYTHRERERE